MGNQLMAKTNSTIKLLPVEAQLQLKSSVALNSLNDAITGLIKNSLDAQAQRIHVEIDYSKGNCCVEDDGVGISGADFEARGGLGLMHCEEHYGLGQMKLLTIYRHLKVYKEQ
jgi:DNA mismatch repair protein MLH3